LRESNSDEENPIKKLKTIRKKEGTSDQGEEGKARKNSYMRGKKRGRGKWNLSRQR